MLVIWFYRFLKKIESMETNGPKGVANSDPRDKVGRIYVGDTKHCYTLNTQAVGLMVLEKSFSIISLRKLMITTTGASPIWTAGAWFAGFT